MCREAIDYPLPRVDKVWAISHHQAFSLIWFGGVEGSFHLRTGQDHILIARTLAWWVHLSFQDFQIGSHFPAALDKFGLPLLGRVNMV